MLDIETLLPVEDRALALAGGRRRIFGRLFAEELIENNFKNQGVKSLDVHKMFVNNYKIVFK